LIRNNTKMYKIEQKKIVKDKLELENKLDIEIIEQSKKFNEDNSKIINILSKIESRYEKIKILIFDTDPNFCLVQNKINNTCFDQDDLWGLTNECYALRFTKINFLNVYDHLDLFKVLLKYYLRTEPDLTSNLNIIDSFLNEDIKNRLVKKAWEKHHWYIVKYLLKIGASPIDSYNLYFFLSVRHNKNLLTYILDNYRMNICSEYENIYCDDTLLKKFNNSVRNSGCGMTMNNHIGLINYDQQMKIYFYYILRKFLLIYQLFYPISNDNLEYNYQLIDVFQCIRKYYLKLHNR